MLFELVISTAFIGFTNSLAADLYCSSTCKQHASSKTFQDTNFPIAPASMWKTLTTIATPQGPWFLVDQTRHLKSANFFLRLPLDMKRMGVFVVGDSKAAREIMMHPQADKPQAYYGSFLPMTNGVSNIFASSNNSYWTHTRKGIAPAFSNKEITRMNQICKEHLDRWVRRTIEPLAASGGTFEPGDSLAELTFHIICEAAFEYQPTREEYELFKKHLEIGLREFSSRQASNPLRAHLAFFYPEVREAIAARDWIVQFSNKVLKAYRDKPNKSASNTVIRLLEENTNFANDDERVANIQVLLVAGHETTGHTLASLLYNLSQAPNVTARVRQELNDLNPKDWAKSALMQQVIRESNRLFPVAAMVTMRTAGRDIVIDSRSGSSKMTVPKGSIVFMPQLVMTRNEEYFANPDKFDPSRWDADRVTSDMMESHNLMFAAGSRNCIGLALAMAEINTVLSTLIKNYDFTLEDPGKVDFCLTLKIVGSRLSVKRAN